MKGKPPRHQQNKTLLQRHRRRPCPPPQGARHAPRRSCTLPVQNADGHGSGGAYGAVALAFAAPDLRRVSPKVQGPSPSLHDTPPPLRCGDGGHTPAFSPSGALPCFASLFLSSHACRFSSFSAAFSHCQGFENSLGFRAFGFFLDRSRFASAFASASASFRSCDFFFGFGGSGAFVCRLGV